MNADGSDPRLVTELDGFSLSAPDWSPDGGRLIFVGLSAADGRSPADEPGLVHGQPGWIWPDQPHGLARRLRMEPVLVTRRRRDRLPPQRGGTTVNLELIDVDGDPAGIVFDDPEAPRSARSIGPRTASSSRSVGPGGVGIGSTKGISRCGRFDVMDRLTNLTTEGFPGSRGNGSPRRLEPTPNHQPSPVVRGLERTSGWALRCATSEVTRGHRVGQPTASTVPRGPGLRPRGRGRPLLDGGRRGHLGRRGGSGRRRVADVRADRRCEIDCLLCRPSRPST